MRANALLRRLPVVLAVPLLLVSAWAVNAIEGRVNPEWVRRGAISFLASEEPPRHAQGKLVAVSGPTQAEGIGDGMFLKPGPYLMVRRDFERYGWMQRVTGEATATAPAYSYDQEWSYNLHDSTGFAVREGHENPEPHLEKFTYLPKEAHVGRYTFNPSDAMKSEILAEGERLALTQDLLDFGRLRGVLHGGYVYYEDADPLRPKPGDVRISYYVVPQDSVVTVTGTLEGQAIRRGQRSLTIETGRNLDNLQEAGVTFGRSQWRRRLLGAAVLLAAYWFACWFRLRRGRAHWLALPMAVLLTGWSAAAAFYLDGLRAFGAVMVPAALTAWWLATGAGGGDSVTSRKAPLDEAAQNP